MRTTWRWKISTGGQETDGDDGYDGDNGNDGGDGPPSFPPGPGGPVVAGELCDVGATKKKHLK